MWVWVGGCLCSASLPSYLLPPPHTPRSITSQVWTRGPAAPAPPVVQQRADDQRPRAPGLLRQPQHRGGNDGGGVKWPWLPTTTDWALPVARNHPTKQTQVYAAAAEPYLKEHREGLYRHLDDKFSRMAPFPPGAWFRWSSGPFKRRRPPLPLPFSTQPAGTNSGSSHRGVPRPLLPPRTSAVAQPPRSDRCLDTRFPPVNTPSQPSAKRSSARSPTLPPAPAPAKSPPGTATAALRWTMN